MTTDSHARLGPPATVQDGPAPIGVRVSPCPPASPVSGMGAFLPPGWRVLRHDSLESTNATARDLALRGCPEGTVVLADEQTEGRGRLGRSWHSPAGRGLWVSVVLRPGLEQARLPQLTLLAAVAVARAVEACAGVSPEIGRAHV